MTGDADVLLVGGRIFTASRKRPWARALAVRGDRLVAVGTDAQAERWSGRHTKVVNLKRRVVLPGFVDAHAHLCDSAGELGWIRLDGTKSLSDALDRLRTAAARAPPGEWVLGVDWDEAKWPESRYPTREDLDLVSTDRPVVARRIDCHMASLNSRALGLAEDLAGARGFEVDAAGRPTGVLKEDAFEAFHRRFEPGEERIRRGLSTMTRTAHRLGITSIHDVVDLRAWRVCGRARRTGHLRLRIYAMPRDSMLPTIVASGLVSGLGDEWLRLGAVKVFADGSLGARTAALRKGYVDGPRGRGILVHSRDELKRILETAHRAGLQTATHAIGDEAIDQVVSVLEEIQTMDPRRDARHRIEHFELPDEEVLRRTKAAGLIASCQPNFVGQWSGPRDLYEIRLGAERASRNNPYRKILAHRIPLCFGSDGMPYGPLYGIHWAVNGFFADQRLPPEEAFRTATLGGAYASFEEHLKGTLDVGKLADFVVLEDDPFAEPDRIRNVRVHSTWIAGSRVYQRMAKR